MKPSKDIPCLKMYKTAWTKKASSFPSDHIRPSYPHAPQSKNKSKETPNQPHGPPKSAQVVALEGLITALNTVNNATKDPEGGCFCQARMHALSAHTPLCRTCGLILCTLNPPQHTCPSCNSPLLSPPQLTSLLVRLETQLAQQIAQEERVRVRAAEEARRAAGAFPTLSSGTAAGAPAPPLPAMTQPQPQAQTHKVLSLNAKTKRVVVSSYATPPRSVTPVTPFTVAEPLPVRLPAPPTEVSYVHVKLGVRGQEGRNVWVDLSGEGAKYVHKIEDAAILTVEGGSKGPGRKRRRKGKGKAEDTDAPNGGDLNES